MGTVSAELFTYYGKGRWGLSFVFLYGSIFYTGK